MKSYIKESLAKSAINECGEQQPSQSAADNAVLGGSLPSLKQTSPKSSPPEQPPGEIVIALARLNEARGSIERRLVRLTKRLEPVLRMEPDQNPNRDPQQPTPGPVTQLALNIETETVALMGVADHITRLISKLEL